MFTIVGLKGADYMLIAYNHLQQLFHPYQYTREALQKYRRQMTFFCPQCLEPVHLKIGSYTIPHFAHHTQNQCSKFFAEGESKLHLQGKIQLFEWLQKLRLKVELEPYLTELSQRPDLLVAFDNNNFALEFQCSPITHDKWQKRTIGYETNNIQPIWLFLTPQRNEAITGIRKISISPLLQKSFMTTSTGLPYLMTFNAKTEQFVYWTNLLHVHGHTFIGKVQKISIKQQRFPFYIPTCISLEEFQQYWQLYKRACQQFANRRLLQSKQGVHDSFLRSCYEMNFSISAMPSYIGIPVKEGTAISLFASEWQTMLWFFSQQLGLEPYDLKKHHIQDFLIQYHLKYTGQAVKAVQQYSRILKGIKQDQKLQDICEQVYAQLFAIAAIY
ncbi:competence protein CoiA [Lysinibacillus sp. VIII_CA]|uniref:competence protein CoiA n=2 Tax=Bacillaceae TaxID=186817 RepID=UPI001F1AD736|nr:competence protein CoiA family protein [Lysinibacillus sphaericus]